MVITLKASTSQPNLHSLLRWPPALELALTIPYLIGSSVHRLAKRGSLMDRNPVPLHPSKSSAELIQLVIGGGSSALAAGDHHTQISTLSLLY